MTTTNRPKQRPGVSPAWSNLPRRRCDNCNEFYKPKRPRHPNEHGFCKDDCRKSFHKNGGAYRKLKPEVEKMVRKEFSRIDAELKELRTLWLETEASVIKLRSQVGPYDVDKLTRQLVDARLGERVSIPVPKNPTIKPAVLKSNPRFPS